MMNCKEGEIMNKYDKILNTKIVKEQINEAMEKSKSGKEHGFNICLNGEDITTTEIVDGNSNSITMENTCPGVKVGSFHVHPMSQIVYPSPKDFVNINENDGEKFLCIGANVNDGNRTRKVVQCFDREDSVGF